MSVDAPACDVAFLPEPAPRAPRLWTVFVALVVALVGAAAAQVVCMIAILAWQVAEGGEIRQVAEGLAAQATTPKVFVLLGLAGQLGMGLCAVVAALLSPQSMRHRLGLVRPAVSATGFIAIVIGSLVPLALGVSCAVLLARVIPPDPMAQRLYEQMTADWAVPFILFISLAPGFVEEILFRGYVQTRLLQRWRPWVAILVTSLVFGLYHITAHSVLNAFVIGLWLGVVAWRTGSVWPGIACHAFINGIWNIWHVGQRVWGFPEEVPITLAVLVALLSLACFLGSIQILRSCRIEAIHSSARFSIPSE